MWGNKEGWLVSTIILALMGWMLWTFGRPEGISKPSGQFANLTDPIRLPVLPDEVLPGIMTEDRDAGDAYWQAIQLYLADAKAYKTFDFKNVGKASEIKPVGLILKATGAKRASIFINRPQILVNYKFPWPEMDAASRLGQLVNSIGHYYVVSKTNADETQAKRYLHAGFSLGTKLYEERVIESEMISGIQLMRGAADSLRELAKRKGDAAAEQALLRFGNETNNYYTTKIQKLYQKVGATGVTDLRVYAGDVFALATKNPDRMWRTEALLKIGRYKFEKGGSVGDQLWARRLLDEPQRFGFPDFAQDADPAVRAAAAAARDLTLEGFGRIKVTE